MPKYKSKRHIHKEIHRRIKHVANKVSTKDAYRIACIIITAIAITLCYLHRENINGTWHFVPRIPGKQWWTVAGYLIFSMFSSKITMPRNKAIQHTCGMLVVVLLMIVSIGEYFNIDMGSQLWTAVGSLIGIYTNMKESRRNGTG